MDSSSVEARVAAATAAAARRLEAKQFRDIVTPQTLLTSTSGFCTATFTGTKTRARIDVLELEAGMCRLKIVVGDLGLTLEIAVAGEHLESLRTALGRVSDSPEPPPSPEDGPTTEQDTSSSTVRTRGRRPVRPMKA